MRQIYTFPGFTRQHLDKELIVECLAAEFSRGYVDSTYYKKRGNIHKIGELLQVNNPRLLVLEQSSSAEQSVADVGDLEDIAEPETRVDAELTGPDGDSGRFTADNPGGDGTSARSSSHTRVGCHLRAIPETAVIPETPVELPTKERPARTSILRYLAKRPPVAELDRDWLVQPEEPEGDEAVGPLEG
ncbi:hypothetical protein CONLIGDRAFT_687552 [Coniochaeta ligniaria NRRL 30616]|uniref:Uncharacterized protein n=1 Tax=Coniochaeta ligniaria NRRL 30616 TaxID=1408157 RepID=A0A1J7I4Y8_9PEZI|nr:hypothetical protein CONLIGDRAFT_687552 [Coniochaeta ligniaria NRRL 30616]